MYQAAKFIYITRFCSILPSYSLIISFYDRHKQDFKKISCPYKQHREFALDTPPIPSWFEEGKEIEIYLYKIGSKAQTITQMSEFARANNGLCGGYHGLCWLWESAKGKLPEDGCTFFSPYENPIGNFGISYRLPYLSFDLKESNWELSFIDKGKEEDNLKSSGDYCIVFKLKLPHHT